MGNIRDQIKKNAEITSVTSEQAFGPTPLPPPLPPNTILEVHSNDVKEGQIIMRKRNKLVGVAFPRTAVVGIGGITNIDGGTY